MREKVGQWFTFNIREKLTTVCSRISPNYIQAVRHFNTSRIRNLLQTIAAHSNTSTTLLGHDDSSFIIKAISDLFLRLAVKKIQHYNVQS